MSPTKAPPPAGGLTGVWSLVANASMVTVVAVMFVWQSVNQQTERVDMIDWIKASVAKHQADTVHIHDAIGDKLDAIHFSIRRLENHFTRPHASTQE